MNYDLQKILESKRRYREQLAARPIAEKLAMLDQLRERALTIRGSDPLSSGATVVKEAPGDYHTPPPPGTAGTASGAAEPSS